MSSFTIGERAETEKWLPVPGFERRYEVSDIGQVRSLTRMVPLGRWPGHFQRKPGKILKLHASSEASGRRPRVSLGTPGAMHSYGVHKLVALAFLGPPPLGMAVLHWDDDPWNNTPSNLRYGTRSDNQRDRVRNGRHYLANKTHCKHGHEFTPENTLRTKQFPNKRACRRCAKERRAARRQDGAT